MRAATVLLLSATSLLQAQALENGDAACTSYCSREQPGTSVIEILWRFSPTPLAVAESRKRLTQQTIQVSVYKDGFERGLFATLPSVTPKAIFRLNKAQIPGMRNLVVTRVGTTSDTSARTRLRLLNAPGAPAESAAVRVDGVQPGMAYTWRVPAIAGGFQLVTCRAAICPVDSEAEPPRRPAAAKPK